MIAKLKKDFISIFDVEDEKGFFSPGRVNLIGEYTDLAGGYVLPAALEIGTYALVRGRTDSIFRFYSSNMNDGIHTFSISNLEYRREDNWCNYLKGMIAEYMKLFPITYGLDILIEGNIPNGAGLSSSASVEILMGHILIDYFCPSFSHLECIKVAQKCENEYIGVKCGIMDQFAVEMGKKDHAMFLNTKTLEVKYAPFNFKNVDIVIMNTNKKRGLQDSKYNERRDELESGKNYLKDCFEFVDLCDISFYDFSKKSSLITDEKIRKRVSHVLSENERVKKALNYLSENNLFSFCDLLNESHESLKNDFNVTGAELDTLVESAIIHGAVGARMTGAGFGGCAIFIAIRENTEKIIAGVKKDYKMTFGIQPDFYRVRIGEGARRLY